ncbi:dihydrolipoyl dehydrogenase [Psychrilyobacter sp.]|uniref:dihydrolipoyl dehydrogenase n=1 Tax=Psychrilyobacter sp. TaxID=2586924 RepID=UPI0030161A24
MNIIKLKKISGHAKSGKVTRIYIGVLDSIKKGDKLLDIESKKGNVTIISEYDTDIVKLLVEVGEVLNIDDGICEVSSPLKISSGSSAKTPLNTSSKPSTTKSAPFNYFGKLIKPKEVKKITLEVDIAILGGGPGGYVAALHGGLTDKKIVIIEKNNLGGTCLNEGCIPTKTLVRSAEVFNLVKDFKEFGVTLENPKINLKDVISRKDRIVEELVGGIDYLLKNRDVTIVKGKGEVLEKNKIIVKENNVETTIIAQNIILATGGKVSKLNLPGIDLEGVITSTEALNLCELPKKLLIVGGGIIGMEFAFIYASFGVDVTIIEFDKTILNTLDSDVVDVILESAKLKGIRIVTKSAVEEIIRGEDSDLIVRVKSAGENRFYSTEKVLVAVGRSTSLDGIHHEKLGIELNARKTGIEVDEYMRTNIDNIYAIGDLTEKFLLAHVASHQGIIAIDHILGKENPMDYSVVPNVVFTIPEIAVVGLTELELERRNKDALDEEVIEVNISKFPIAANGKAQTLGETLGFVKLIENKQTKQLLGGTVVGIHASDMITEISLCIKKGLSSKDIAHTIHAHPTTAESVHEAALGLNGGSLHFE